MAAVRAPHTLYARERRLKRYFFIGFSPSVVRTDNRATSPSDPDSRRICPRQRWLSTFVVGILGSVDTKLTRSGRLSSAPSRAQRHRCTRATIRATTPGSVRSVVSTVCASGAACSGECSRPSRPSRIVCADGAGIGPGNRQKGPRTSREGAVHRRSCARRHLNRGDPHDRHLRAATTRKTPGQPSRPQSSSSRTRARSAGRLLATMWVVAISRYRQARDASAISAADQKTSAPGASGFSASEPPQRRLPPLLPT